MKNVSRAGFTFVLIALMISASGNFLKCESFEGRRSMEIPLVERGPELRGDLSDPLWNKASSGTGFVLNRTGEEPGAQTEVKVLADGGHLYIGYILHEPDMENRRTRQHVHGGSIWSDDSVDFQIDPANAGIMHYQWIVNSNGAVWQGLQSEWKSVLPAVHAEGSAIDVETAVAENMWTIEIKVPFSFLGADLGPGDVWGINFGRHRRSSVNEISAWSKTTAGFLDPSQLGRVHVPLKMGDVSVLADTRGGLAAALGERGFNIFGVSLRNEGRRTRAIKALVTAGDEIAGKAEFALGAGRSRDMRLPYEIDETAEEIKFLVYVDGRIAYERSARAVPASERPFRAWVLEDPLYEELLGDEPPGLASEGAIIWSHDFGAPLLRETAKRFGVRYAIEDVYETAGRLGLRTYCNFSVRDDGSVLYAAGVREGVHRFDPELMEKYDIGVCPNVTRGRLGVGPEDDGLMVSLIRNLLEKPRPHLWGISAGDERPEGVLHRGVQFMSDPPEGLEEYMKQADREVREVFGGGEWGIPESGTDANPYRWIAFSRWANEKLRERHGQLHDLIRSMAPGVRIKSTNPTNIVYGWEYSTWGRDFDIITHQFLPRGSQWRQSAAYLAKLLADTTGREVWPCMHVERYAFNTTPEETREKLSQVIRGGGHGFHFYLPDVQGYRGRGFDTRVTMFGSPRRYHTIMNIVEHVSSMSRPRYPGYGRTAIIHNDDTFQSTSVRGARENWENSEACFTFLGPVARSWFRFIDIPQVLEEGCLREEFDVIYLPVARYQQKDVVEKLFDFVKRGGMLVCGEPRAFDTDIHGNDTSGMRKEIFGVDVGGMLVRRPSRVELKVAGKAHTARVYHGAFEFIPLPGTEVIGRFNTGEPAVTVKRHGEGRAVLFASNPFHINAPASEEMRELFKSWVDMTGAPSGFDIWRFQLPDSVIWAPPPRSDFCLTNNNVEWREETPYYVRNYDTKGSYAYSRAPDDWPDAAGAGESISFEEGRLTDRRRSIHAETWVERGWYQPYKLPASEWVVRWRSPEPVEITFDLKESYSVNEVKLWFSGSLPPAVVSGSEDGREWAILGRAAGEEAGEDVLDRVIKLDNSKPWRYIMLSLDRRREGGIMEIIEAEIWGDF